jgi:hypothetical protein
MNTQCKKYGIVQTKNDSIAHFVGPNKDEIEPRKDYWLQNITNTEVSGLNLAYLIGDLCVLKTRGFFFSFLSAVQCK